MYVLSSAHDSSLSLLKLDGRELYRLAQLSRNASLICEFGSIGHYIL